MMTLFGMSPALWLFVFIIGYLIYLYISSKDRESSGDENLKNTNKKEDVVNNQKNNISNRSVFSWLIRFLGGIIAVIGFIFFMYVLTHFSA